MSSSSTPAPYARTPTTSSTATSATSPAPQGATHAGMQIAVGGCLAQKDKSVILEQGAVGRRRLRHAQHGLAPEPPRAGAPQRRGRRVEILESLEGVPVDAADPQARTRRYRGWVSISVGCNNTCTFCIVPLAARQGEGPPPRRHPRRDPGARGRRGRRGDAPRPERQLLRRRVRRPASRSASSSAPPGGSTGLERRALHQPAPRRVHRRRHRGHGRRRRTSCPQLHMPLQSGSDRILRAMRRSYRSERFLGILDRVRAEHAGRGDHRPTSSWASPARPRRTSPRPSASSKRRRPALRAFTFQYSIRPGTPAATMAEQVPKRGRARALRAPHRASGAHLPEENHKLVGPPPSSCPRRRERAAHETRRLSGRAADSRLVHFAVPAGCEIPRPGDVVTVDDRPGRAVSTSSPTPPTRRAAPPCAVPRPATPWDRAGGRESCAVPRRREAFLFSSPDLARRLSRIPPARPEVPGLRSASPS